MFLPGVPFFAFKRVHAHRKGPRTMILVSTNARDSQHWPENEEEG